MPWLHEWWWGKDSNLGRRKPADLQSALVDHLSIPPGLRPRLRRDEPNYENGYSISKADGVRQLDSD